MEVEAALYCLNKRV